jgi:VWFA-related protein
MTRRIGVWLLAGSVASAWLHAQQPARPLPPRFFSEAELVTVDASVVDRDGQPIRDLEQKDFIVFENGKPQEIVAFRAISVPRYQAMSPPRTARVSTNTEPRTPGRTFVVLFDDLHLTTTQAQRGRMAVVEFLKTGTAPGDRVSLIATGSDVWRHARMPEGQDELIAIAESLKGQYPLDSSAERISEWEAYRIDVHQDMDVALQVKRRFDSFGAAGQSKLSGPIPREEIAKSSLEGIIDPVIRMRAASVYNAAISRNKKTMTVLSRALRSVADMPGRKSVLLVSQGFVHEPDLGEMREAIRASLRANAPVYFVNTRGLLALAETMNSAQTNPIDAQDTLVAMTNPERESEGAESMALDTGGFAIEHTNDLARGLLQVSRESNAYYLLGYRPPDPQPDGRFRRIEVRLRGERSGVTVKARRGYYTVGNAAPESKAGEDPTVVSALDGPYDVPDIPLRAMAFAFDAASAGRVNVQVTTDVDVRPFKFTERNGRFDDSMAFVIEVRENATGQRYRYDEQVEMSLQPLTRERLWRTWYSVSREFALPRGRYAARIVVRDLAGGRLGSITHEFDVPDVSEFRTSTPILTDLVESHGTPALLRPVLIARRTFPRGSILYCQYLVYGAAADGATGMPRVTAGYEVRRITVAAGATNGSRPADVFKHSAPSPIAPPVLGLNTFATGTLKRLHGISLAGASPGEYELTLTVTDEIARRTLTMREPFTILGDQ